MDSLVGFTSLNQANQLAWYRLGVCKHRPINPAQSACIGGFAKMVCSMKYHFIGLLFKLKVLLDCTWSQFKYKLLHTQTGDSKALDS